MKKLITFLLSFVIIFSFASPSFASNPVDKSTIDELTKRVKQLEDELQKRKEKVSKVVDEVNNSVVAIIGINTQYRQGEDIYSKYPSNLQHGSGVVINSEGQILTNNHVVDGVKDIYVVTYDGSAYKAKLLYTDKDIDLALISIERKDLKPIKLADPKNVKVGDEVVAIGTPLFFGYRNSASSGIISGLNRPVDGIYTYLQTDASVNPGNSGGPLVNMDSELVGINTLGYTFYQGMNFSIPVDNVNYFLDHYKKYGKIKRCFTGIEFEENWAALLGIPTNQGLRVVTVQKDAVVTSDQVKEGDILESVDGSATTSIAQYNEILKKHLPGDKAKLTFSRGEKTFDIIVVLKEKPVADTKAKDTSKN